VTTVIILGVYLLIGVVFLGVVQFLSEDVLRQKEDTLLAIIVLIGWPLVALVVAGEALYNLLFLLSTYVTEIIKKISTSR